MRKNIYLMGIFLTIISFNSCQKELDNWYTETASYDGRYVVATTCEEYSDDDTSIEDGIELMIYNSAANVKDEIWLDTEVAGAHIKAKFKITGDISLFKSDETVSNIASTYYYIFRPTGGIASFSQSNANSYYGVPTSEGTLIDGIQLYTRVTLEEGKIIPKSATTIGGNTSDSIYVKAVMHHDFVVFESYTLPEDEWEDPQVPEYAWRLKPGSNTPAPAADWDEHWTLAGYRYTGMPEDM